MMKTFQQIRQRMLCKNRRGSEDYSDDKYLAMDGMRVSGENRNLKREEDMMNREKSGEKSSRINSTRSVKKGP